MLLSLSILYKGRRGWSVRKYAGTLPVAEAVERAVNYCIRHNILYDFLLKHRAEVVEVCLFEYDEELHLKSVKEEGTKKGISEGVIIGENRLAKLLRILRDSGRMEELDRAISDPEYRMKLYQEFQIGTSDVSSETGV